MAENVWLATAQALRPQLLAAAAEIERDRRLPPALVQALVDAGLFRLTTARALGGAEVDPLTLADVVEELASADASTGWCVQIGANSAWGLSAFMPEHVAADIYSQDKSAIIGGTLLPTGRAIPTTGGYRISGRWGFISGAPHATWMQNGCVVLNGDVPRLTATGAPERRAFLVPTAAGAVIDTWSTTGLRGTGSHDFAVTDVFVPEERSFAFPFGAPLPPGPLYRWIALPFISIASVPLGIARSAITEFVRLAETKTMRGTNVRLRDAPTVQVEVAKAEALWGSSRAYLYETAAEVWRILLAGQEPSAQQRARLRLAITHAVASAVQAVDLMYSAAGATAIYATSPLERYFRDVHTAAAHWQVGPRLYEATGRVFLGLVPEPPFF
jgi:indole-3-acetate monooxygenase